MEVNLTPKSCAAPLKRKRVCRRWCAVWAQKRNLGRGYVNFRRTPLMTYLKPAYVPDWREAIDPIEAVRSSRLTPTVNSIADLMVCINNAGAANAMELRHGATGLPASVRRTREQLTQQLECYLSRCCAMCPILRMRPPHPPLASELIDHALQMNV